ncbi:MAG: Gfo/Idh/MocA family oxidoreductase [Alphaproteobacteria bacterium]|nr:Gfo/Idh/MocA family oxidoreductase [Alphaproteobacteria bacterium]MDE2492490.1 Gfo/Idh/MocA family oxidoreductase [Alphaproteobacteria bacterium]
MGRIRVGIVGVGKIAKDQHIPVIRTNVAFELAACASRVATVDGIANFADVEAMLADGPELDAVAICTPPQAHYQAARLALQHGKHVFLEKPPCETTTQLDELIRQAHRADRTLFQTWHAQHAAAVDAAQLWLRSRGVRGGRIIWKEDVRQWHPGQAWIWQAGGFGVFDPGINAVSILTKIVPEPIFVSAADLFFPVNCSAPIAANVTFVTASGAQIDAAFDFRYTSTPTWDIDIEVDRGTLHLAKQGNALIVDGKPTSINATETEYTSLYRRFAELIDERRSDVDRRPFQLVADIFLIGQRSTVEPFEE